jgi:hypothetical protein
MSQISTTIYVDNKNYRVQAGWDNPLQCYHITVFDPELCDDDEVVWDLWDHYDFGDCSDFDLIREAFEARFPEANCSEMFWNKCQQKLGNVMVSL